MPIQPFQYRNGALHCEEVSADAIAATYGTPVFVYSKAGLQHAYREIRDAFAPVNAGIHYAIKALSNLSILKVFKDEGAGFDVVSVGEIKRLLRIGVDPLRIIYAGVGKSPDDIRFSLQTGIGRFNVENAQELNDINRIAAELGVRGRVALRINPDVDPETHVYITTGKKDNKFGLDLKVAESLVKGLKNYPHVEMTGLHMHLGSFLTKVEPYVESIRRALAFAEVCRRHGVEIKTLNIGGGFAIEYNEAVPPVADFAKAIVPLMKQTGVRLHMEPGRYLVGNNGVLLARVLYIKDNGEKRFVITDGGMNDVIRPALYQAYHRIWPARAVTAVDDPKTPGLRLSDIVGPVCESGDFFAKDRMFPAVERGELIALFSAGAYCASMSSRYNSRGFAAEVMVDGNTHRAVRLREPDEHQWDLEEKCL